MSAISTPKGRKADRTHRTAAYNCSVGARGHRAVCAVGQQGHGAGRVSQENTAMNMRVWRSLLSKVLSPKNYQLISSQNFTDFPGGSGSKASFYNAGDPGLIPGPGKSPGEGNGTLLQYSCLENPKNRGAW